MSFRVDLKTPELVNRAECLLCTLWRDVVILAMTYENISKSKELPDSIREKSMNNCKYYRETYTTIYNEDYFDAERKVIGEWFDWPDVYQDKINQYNGIIKERKGYENS